MTLLCLFTMVIPINKTASKMMIETVTLKAADKHLQHTPGLLALKIQFNKDYSSKYNLPCNSGKNKIKINYLAGSSIFVEMEFGDVGFCGRKTGEPRQNPSEQGGNQQTQPTYGTQGGIGPHWWEAGALKIAGPNLLDSRKRVL